LSMPGIFMWSKDGLPPFAVREMTGSKGKWVWGEPLDPKFYFFSKDFRHAAMMIKDDKLLVFWSKVGDNPERILMTEVGKRRIYFYILTKDSSGRGLDKVESDRRRRDTQA